MRRRILAAALLCSATVLVSGCCTTHPWCKRWCAPRAAVAAAGPGCCPPAGAGVVAPLPPVGGPPAVQPGLPPGAGFTPAPPLPGTNGFSR